MNIQEFKTNYSTFENIRVYVIKNLFVRLLFLNEKYCIHSFIALRLNRIFIYELLIEKFSEAEIRLMLWHEIGHKKFGNDELTAQIFATNQMLKEGNNINFLIDSEINFRFYEKYKITFNTFKRELLKPKGSV